MKRGIQIIVYVVAGSRLERIAFGLVQISVDGSRRVIPRLNRPTALFLSFGHEEVSRKLVE
jgi:hypothetical protein